MYRPYLIRYSWLALAGLLLISLAPGCGDNNPSKSQPSPVLSISLDNNYGLIFLTVGNTGGSMSEPDIFVASFDDGKIDTLSLSLDQNDTIVCQLSNIHGGVTVTNEKRGLEATIGDCLAGVFDNIAASVNFNALVSTPAATMTFLTCTYSIYINNLHYDNVSSQLTRTADGLTLTYVYSNITGNFAGTSPGLLCADFTGNMTMSSITVVTHIDISQDDNPTVTFGDTQTTISGFNVNVDGLFGFIVNWLVDFFQDQFATLLEGNISTAINSSAGSDLSSLVIVNISCAE